jgi:V8-like Glu-specific endopeptidase
MKSQTLLALILSLLTTAALANIYGEDDRVSYYEIADEKIKELADSSVALIPKHNIERLADGRFKLKAKTLKEMLGMCEDSLFSLETLTANCSAALVKDDIILSAGHCVTKNGAHDMGLNDYYAVFNYRKESAEQTEFFLNPNDVYELREFVYHQFVGAYGEDVTLIRLDRKADRKPLKIAKTKQTPVGTPLFILGYPLGVSLKLAMGSSILSYNHNELAFRHQLDAFSVNSGSPVFNLETLEIIGVHVRGTGGNLERSPGRTCDDWRAGDESRDWDEANYLVNLPPF